MNMLLHFTNDATRKQEASLESEIFHVYDPQSPALVSESSLSFRPLLVATGDNDNRKKYLHI